MILYLLPNFCIVHYMVTRRVMNGEDKGYILYCYLMVLLSIQSQVQIGNRYLSMQWVGWKISQIWTLLLSSHH